MIRSSKTKRAELTPVADTPRYPGTVEALDGSTAVVLMETAASEGAGAYPITPSTQMGEGWAAAVAEGKRNVNGRKLLFFEPGSGYVIVYKRLERGTFAVPRAEARGAASVRLEAAALATLLTGVAMPAAPCAP